MRKGFTIIEALISMLLLTITLVGSMAFYFHSQGYFASVNHRRIAAEIASAELEDIKTDGYTAIPAAGAWTVRATKLTQRLSAGAIGGMPGWGEIYVIDNSEGYKEVQVTIFWNQPGKSTVQEVTLDTYIAPR